MSSDARCAVDPRACVAGAPVGASPPDFWSNAYVGLSKADLVRPGRPSGCWELTRAIYRGERGVSLPARSAGSGWREVDPEKAEDFDLVVFRQGGIDSHVGLIAGGAWQMLHLPEEQKGRPPEFSRLDRFDNGSYLPRLSGIYRGGAVPCSPFGRSDDAGASPADPRASVVRAPANDNVVTLLGRPFINPEAGAAIGVPFGKNLADLVTLLYPAASEDQRARMRVSVGRAGVPLKRWTEYDPANWHIVIPHPGVQVAVEPLPGAIPWGKVVALLAITAAFAAGQYYLGPIIAASSFSAFSGTLGSLAVATGVAAASLVLSGLAPGSKTSVDRPAYAATGWANEARLFQPVPDPFGKTRDAPGYGGLPYLSMDGDTLFLHGLFVEAIGDGVISKRRFGDTPIENYDEGAGSPIVVEEAMVIPGDDWPFSTYDHSVVATDPSTLGVTFENGTLSSDWVERITPRDITGIEPFIRFGAGLYNTNDSDGSAESCSVFFQWRYAPIGTEDWVYTDWTEERTDRRSDFFRSRFFEVPRSTYRIATRKVDHDDNYDDDSSQDGYTWIGLQGHRPEAPFAFRVPVKATAFRVRSTNQLQGNLQAYSRIFSRKALYWNGSAWVLGETANPGAGVRYRLQSPAWAQPVPDADIDLPSLQALSAYADLNGLKYHSKGDQRQKIDAAANEPAIAGRARFRRVLKKCDVVIDRAQDEVQGHITPANGWDISVVTDETPEADAFRVTFSDETSDYATKTRMVPFPGVDEADVTKPLEITLPYTDPETIYREAIRRYYIVFVLRLQRYQASADWDHVTFGAGSRVMFDNGLLVSRVSAFVLMVVGSFVTLGKPVTMEAGKSYQIRFRHLPAPESEDVDSPPADSIVRDVVTVPGETATIMLAGSGVAPAVDNLVTFAEAGEAGFDMIVDAIEEADGLKGTIVCRAHTPALDALIAALVVPDWDGRVGGLPGDGTPPPAFLFAAYGFTSFSTFTLPETLPLLALEFSTYVEAHFTPVAGRSCQMRWRVAGSGVWSIVTVPAGIGVAKSTGTLNWADDHEVAVRVSGGTWSAWQAVPDANLRISDIGDEVRAVSSTILRRAA